MGLAPSQPGVRRISQNIPYGIAITPPLPRLSPPTAPPLSLPRIRPPVGDKGRPGTAPFLHACPHAHMQRCREGVTSPSRTLLPSHLPPRGTGPMGPEVGQDGAQSLAHMGHCPGAGLAFPTLVPTASVPPTPPAGYPTGSGRPGWIPPHCWGAERQDKSQGGGER